MMRMIKHNKYHDVIKKNPQHNTNAKKDAVISNG